MANKGYQFEKTRTFINPYNFVPMGQGPGRANLEEQQDELHTGVLKCRLIVKTSILIPDASKKRTDAEGHSTYPFMKIRGKAMIPASSLRGPIRSVYETLSDSCFCTMRKEHTVSQRSSVREPMLPGLLRWKDGKWELRAAVRYKISRQDFKNFFNNASYGDTVRFESEKHTETIRGKEITTGTVKNIVGEKQEVPSEQTQGRKETAGYQEGFVYIGEVFVDKKQYESIFTFQEEPILGIKQEVIGRAAERLEQVLKEYADADRGKLPDGHTAYQKMRENFAALKQAGKWIPVWYAYNPEPAKGADKTKKTVRNNGIPHNLHLSPACIGRYIYTNSNNDVVEHMGGYHACSSRRDACPACRLFGLIGSGKKGEKGAAGRIRFTDAVWDGTKAPVTEEVTLQELGSPHPSYLLFYMEDGAEYDALGARIRGRKFYWHHEPDPGISETDQKTKMNATMERLEKGEFTFSVYYDGITKQQLQELIWTICAGENQRDSSRCHKIGHAKPFGYGSVKMIVEECLERTWDGRQYAIRSLDSETDLAYQKAFEAEPDARNALEIILDMNTIAPEILVRYPYVEDRTGKCKEGENEIASHQWYSNNKDKKDPYAMQQLPDITKKNLKMKCLNYTG